MPSETSNNRVWSAHALGILERACDHYGGLETWTALRTIRLIPGRLSGLLPWLKGVGQTFPLPSAFEIRPRQREARFLNYPNEDQLGVFQDGKVRLEQRASGEVIAASDDHRRTFRGLAIHRRWSALDALYFFGYALTHYHSLPFSLSDARLIRASSSGTGSDRCDVLDVELPADLATHSRRQRFYFDSSGRLTRHDYYAEIVGFWARGAHFWRNQRVFNGLPISLDRYVLGRVGKVTYPLTALHATFSDAEVELER